MQTWIEKFANFAAFSYLFRLLFVQKNALSFARFSPSFLSFTAYFRAKKSAFRSHVFRPARFSCRVCANLTRKIRELESKNSRILQRFLIFFDFFRTKNRPFARTFFALFPIFYGLFSHKKSPFRSHVFRLLFVQKTPFRSHVFRPFSYLLRLIFAQKIALSFAWFLPFVRTKNALSFPRFSPFARFSCKVCANLTRKIRELESKNSRILQRFPIFFAFCSYKNALSFTRFSPSFLSFTAYFQKKIALSFACFSPFVRTKIALSFAHAAVRAGARRRRAPARRRRARACARARARARVRTRVWTKGRFCTNKRRKR